MASVLKRFEPADSLDDVLEGGQRILLNRGRFLNPDLYKIEFEDGRPPLVLKTFSQKHFLVRHTVGRFLTKREFQAMMKLQGIDGVCRVVPVRDRWRLAMEWVEGDDLVDVPSGELNDVFFDLLEACVEQIHDRGMVHLDLGHRGNIRVDVRYRPVLLDFQAAMSVEYFPRFLKKYARNVDRYAVLKWKIRKLPESVSDRDKVRYRNWRLFSRIWPFHHWFFWPGRNRKKTRGKRNGV